MKSHAVKEHVDNEQKKLTKKDEPGLDTLTGQYTWLYGGGT